jgi:hypothetical protein
MPPAKHTFWQQGQGRTSHWLRGLRRLLQGMKTMSIQGAGSRIREQVTRWPGVSAHPHRFGGTQYRIGRREIGHVHGDWLVDIPFPTKVRDAIVALGRAEPHHILPESGWVSFYLREAGDVEKAVSLLRESYEIAMKQKSKPETGEAANG